MSIPVFDLHCDSAFTILGRDLQSKIPLLSNSLHIDLERAGKLIGYAQFFACFTAPGIRAQFATPTQLFEKELSALLYQLEINRDKIRLAYSAGEIVDYNNNGLMSAILSIEGPAGFDFDPALLEDLYKIGFRMTTLGWNENNVLAGSHLTGGGLTDRGREYVREAQRLGMIIDVSHLSDEAFWDVMDMTQAPVVASHSNSRAIWDCSRNISDDMFRAISNTGGVAGMNMFVDFIGKDVSLDDLCNHILHFMELDPNAEHIALGGDLDGCRELPSDFAGVQDYNKLADCLRQRGVGEDLIRNIFWNNALGVLKNAVHNNKR